MLGGWSLKSPEWQDLENLIANAKESLLVCSPYITSDGLEHVFDLLKEKIIIDFVTRLSPTDWLFGASDPKALLDFLVLLDEDGWETSLHVHQRLHAKAYIGDKSNCIVGSANLTAGGFDRNFELSLIATGETALQADTLIREEIDARSLQINLDDFKEWVAKYSDTICQLSDNIDPSEHVSDAQRALDELLEHGADPDNFGLLKVPSIDDFMAYVSSKACSPHAKVVLERYTNSKGQNLTGHVRQSFYAGAMFLDQNPDLINQIGNAIDLSENSTPLPVFSDEVNERWISFLKKNALHYDANCNFSVLIGYLPPSLGGTRSGGGGGGSTLKRLLPMLALFHASSSQEAE